ncbi:MAG: DUF883 family protein [Pseudomonadaceae bacterium]|jgi:ElaB/YqjD/DUF883 family membrane-anchored ribosome-binding protein|nr:DUF883 family protein [Pseudomonadaceae bacterium]
MPHTSAHTQQEQLQNELQALIKDAETLLQHAAGLAGEHADQLREQIQHNLQRARASLGTGETALREQANEVREASEAYIQNNPWQAVGIAAGLGLLLGLLLGRR